MASQTTLQKDLSKQTLKKEQAQKSTSKTSTFLKSLKKWGKHEKFIYVMRREVIIEFTTDFQQCDYKETCWLIKKTIQL